MATKRATASASTPTPRSTPAGPTSAAGRDPLAAGTRRATGERKRRTRTPLLPSTPQVRADNSVDSPPDASYGEPVQVTAQASSDGPVGDALSPDPAPVAAAGVD
ncbi:MAG: hypothetical protein M3Y71_18070, partial [Actinomycetota bacterium]|nr:hypothetical protein [Actinomycetota bacterium]